MLTKQKLSSPAQSWKLNGETVQVNDNNEHIGLLVSWTDEDLNYVDEKLL